MGKMELIYLVVGLVVGIALGLIWNRVRRPHPEAVVSQEPRVSPPPLPQTSDPPEPPPLQEEPDALQEQLKQTQLAYHMAQQMSQFKGGFLARTSHELRSPLSSLIGMHQLILSDLCDSPQEEREFVAQANVSAQKMVKLLDEVIAVSKTEHGTNRLEVRPLSITQVFEELEVLTHMQAANRNIHLSIISPQEDIQVLADPRRFQQVLLGLVDSAITQMDEGTLQVSASRSSEEPVVHICLDIRCPNSIWSESIDSLSTMPDPERQLSQKTSLSPGLMLLTIQTLVEVMKGRLELVPIPDQETTSSATGRTLTRLQCSMPLGTPETGESVLAVDL